MRIAPPSPSRHRNVVLLEADTVSVARYQVLKAGSTTLRFVTEMQMALSHD